MVKENKKDKTNYSLWYKIFISYIGIFIAISYAAQYEFISCFVAILALINILFYWSIVNIFNIYIIAGVLYLLIYSMLEISINNIKTLYLNIVILLMQILIYVFIKKVQKQTS